MKTTKTLSLLLLTVILASHVQAQSFSSRQGEDRGTPPGMELPEGFEDMTEEERHEYMQANRPADMGERPNFMGGEMDLPDNWDEMTDDERREYMQANLPEGMPQRGPGRIPQDIDLPDGWDDMSEAEQRAWMEENRPTDIDGSQVQPKTTDTQDTKKARKARNYKKFTGSLATAKTFSDESNIKNLQAVIALQQRGIIDGNSDGSFQPQKGINRAESLKVLLEALEMDSEYAADAGFSDVEDSAWFAKYVNIAKNKGIVKGYEDGTFKPGATVTQSELLKISFESFGIDLSDYDAGDYTGQWYGEYLQYALDNDLIDSASPGTPMTRDEFSDFVYRLIQQQESL